jgi:hypothetical protein
MGDRMSAPKFSGPTAGVCATCGRVIGAYESRYYGPKGAVHIWDPDAPAGKPEFSDCYNKTNAALYPDYYTDG